MRDASISESGNEQCVNAWVFWLFDRGKPKYRLFGGVCVNIVNTSPTIARSESIQIKISSFFSNKVPNSSWKFKFQI